MKLWYAIAALGWSAAAAVDAQSCAEPRGSGALRRVESARYTVSYRIDRAPIVVGRHFALDIAVCPKAGTPRPEALRVDAQMPAHRHGMNYRAGVTAEDTGRFHAEGLLFHMPGRWEFVFDVVANGATERLSSAIEVE
jgi:hypothetical protein